jgi:hypothetical protein
MSPHEVEQALPWIFTTKKMRIPIVAKANWQYEIRSTEAQGVLVVVVAEVVLGMGSCGGANKEKRAYESCMGGPERWLSPDDAERRGGE